MDEKDPGNGWLPVRFANASVSDPNADAPHVGREFAQRAVIRPGTRHALILGAAVHAKRSWSIVPDLWEYPAFRVLQFAVALLAIVVALLTPA